jgi:hypothetical protein
MAVRKPTFIVRALDDDAGYLIEAHWPDGEIEDVSGVHRTMDGAVKWLNEEAEPWVKDRQTTLH